MDKSNEGQLTTISAWSEFIGYLANIWISVIKVSCRGLWGSGAASAEGSCGTRSGRGRHGVGCTARLRGRAIGASGAVMWVWDVPLCEAVGE